MIIAIDPGTTQSGYVLYDGAIVHDSGVIPNESILVLIESLTELDYLACEMIDSYGMPVGKEVFETCVWIGRFAQAFGSELTLFVYRRNVKMHLCNSSRAKDANIRQALIDRFGGPDAIGKKACPGPLYSVKSHAWAALAVAVTAFDTQPWMDR